jgi:hypothetical protein
VGLDIYVGPLTRYYSFDWETIVQQAGREQGMEVEILRPPGFQKPEPRDVIEGVATWRKALGDAVGVPMRWDESLSGAYETDKPDWDGYQAVRFLALHDEFPDLPTPTSIDTRTIDKEPLERRFGEVYARRNQSTVGRLLGRKPPEPTAPPLYVNIHTPELWLPVVLDGVINTTGPAGRDMTIGSVDGLVAELEQVNDSTVRMDQTALDAARTAGPPEDGEFDPLARFGLAVVLALARIAKERSQPMILDY